MKEKVLVTDISDNYWHSISVQHRTINFSYRFASVRLMKTSIWKRKFPNMDISDSYLYSIIENHRTINFCCRFSLCDNNNYSIWCIDFPKAFDQVGHMSVESETWSNSKSILMWVNDWCVFALFVWLSKCIWQCWWEMNIWSVLILQQNLKHFIQWLVATILGIVRNKVPQWDFPIHCWMRSEHWFYNAFDCAFDSHCYLATKH